MARIRTIKPEFWTDEKLSECSLSARLLFIGLISFADDEGRMEYAPARVRMQVFPCGSVTQGSLIEMVGELTEHSLIRIYTLNGKEYLDIPGFIKHQRINRATPSKLPPFSEGSRRLSEHSVTPTPGTGTGTGRERIKEPPPSPPTGDDLSPDLNTDAWHEWLDYRKERKLPPYKPRGAKQAIHWLAAFKPDDQAKIIGFSIRNNYQGLFEPKAGNGEKLTAFERSKRKLDEWCTERGIDPATV